MKTSIEKVESRGAPGYGGTGSMVAPGYGGTGSTVTPVYIVGWYGGYGVLPPLHSYKSGMQRDDGTPYPPYYPAMYTGATVAPVHRTTGDRWPGDSPSQLHA